MNRIGGTTFDFWFKGHDMLLMSFEISYFLLCEDYRFEIVQNIYKLGNISFSDAKKSPNLAKI